MTRRHSQPSVPPTHRVALLRVVRSCPGRGFLLPTVLAVAAAAVVVPAPSAGAQASTAYGRVSAGPLDRGYSQFYNGRYESAVAVALPQCLSDATDLAACELTTAALHFQIRRALGDAKDRDKAWKACEECPALMTTFMEATRRGQDVARTRLEADADDDSALFLLGKVDLNYVWLQLGTLGKKTGWKEYWEARHSLDDLLERSPDHVRGRVARAWIDYIVDTRMPRGTKWLLGGGNRKRGLRVVADAAGEPADFYVATEASFALWDMQVREKEMDEAVVTASKLARDFPENQELIKFLAEHSSDDTP